MSDLLEYLTQHHEATTAAILLGTATARRGSVDATLSKMLCLHIPTLLPAAFAEMEVAPVVQTAALLGVGFLYQGSAHRYVEESLKYSV